MQRGARDAPAILFAPGNPCAILGEESHELQARHRYPKTDLPYVQAVHRRVIMAASSPAFAAHAWLFVDRWDEESGNRAIAEAGRQGFAGIEIPIEHPETLRAASHRIALTRANVAPLCRMALPAGLQAARTPEHAFHRALRAIQAAASLESRLLVASFAWSPQNALDGQPTRTDHAIFVELMAALADEAASEGVILALEPGNRYETTLCNTLSDAASVVLTVASPALTVAADTRTMHMEETGLQSALLGAADLLATLTVRESHAGEAGTGTIAWNDVWDGLGQFSYDGWLVYRCDMAPTPVFAPSPPPEAQLWRIDIRPSATAAGAGVAFLREGVRRMRSGADQGASQDTARSDQASLDPPDSSGAIAPLRTSTGAIRNAAGRLKPVPPRSGKSYRSASGH